MVSDRIERSYDLGILGGTLLDPAQQVHGQYDVAIASGRVAAVEPAIDPRLCKVVIDATGRLVVPGLIDAHVHVFEGVSHYGINADATCLARGACNGCCCRICGGGHLRRLPTVCDRGQHNADPRTRQHFHDGDAFAEDR